PFFLGALTIGTGFTVFTGDIHRIYFSNLTGSGFGAFIVLLSVFHLGPSELILIISLITVGTTLPLCVTRMRVIVSFIFICAVVVLYGALLYEIPVALNDFKDLAQAEKLKGAKREAQVFGSLGLITVVDSPAYHYLPDLSLNCPDPLPRQKGLFLDGNRVGAISRFSGDIDSLHFMNCRTVSLPYKLLEKPRVLIIGGGGGTEVLNARYHGARAISVAEINRDIIHLMRERYGQFSKGIYDGDRITVFPEDGRGYLERTDDLYDLIHINLPGSMGILSAGAYSLNENYIFTVEALETCLNHLSPGGMILLSSGIESPPREGVKILAMAIQALEVTGESEASQSLLMIRSWQAATLLIKKGVFGIEEIRSTREFCRERFFDLCYYPMMKEGEANKFNRMDENYFYRAAEMLLSGKKEEFYDAYPFYIRPATDDRPFFSYFFKKTILNRYLGDEGRTIIPFVDWGYILVWLSLLAVVPASLILILAPLPFAMRFSRTMIPIFLYFGSLGLAYIFLEMALLQHFIRYLHSPVFSASVVVSSFLVYSGIGSIIGGKMWQAKGRHMVFTVTVIFLVGLLYLQWGDYLFAPLSRLPLWMRMLACSIMIAPIALPMGMPFPSGLSLLGGVRQNLIPWAWGINGFFSVIGATTAVIIAVSYGFKAVILSALCLYILAGIFYFPLARGK
ncbi:MAG: hypothetical protein JXB42_09710, partial [Deltaproteobacteria bacterium]|nr:hypothetical protein [Deltaproteobacteria bacterium]